MTFGQPLWFWAFALLPVMLILYAGNERRREKLLRLLVASRLQDQLAGTVSLARRRLRFALLLAALACLIVSMARPRLGYTWEQSKRKGRDVIIAIDCSRSMLATDLPPSRLVRAKLASQDLIGQLTGDRVGLIAFAGGAFLQAPLTVDYGAVLNSLAELDATIIPRGGTNLAAAITEADAAFGKGESDNRCLIIFTDGEELDADGLAAAEAQKDRIRIFTIGLGSVDGSLIPVTGEDGGTSFVKDPSGQIVKSKLDEDRLRKIAEATGGFYLHLQSGPAEMKQIVRDGLGQMKEQEIDARMSRRPIERYQWPLGAALVLLVVSTLISERRRAGARKAMPVALASLLMLCAMPAGAEAKNSGVEAYEREDYKGAMDEFGRQLQRQRDSEALHFNMGAAAYKSGDFGKALEAFAKAVTSPDPQLRAAAEYNLGNTLYRRGAALTEKDKKVREWKDALKHYDQALKVEPQNQNAEFNRDVVRKLLEELEKEPPQSDQQQQQDQQKKDEDKKEDQKQNQDQKDQKEQSEKSEGGEKDEKKEQQSSKDQSSKDQQENKENQPQPQDSKDGKKDESKDDSKPQQDQGEKSDKDQNQQAKNDPGQQPPESSGEKGDKKQEQPQPSPDQPEKKRKGEIQSQGQQPPVTPEQEAAAEAQAAQEGKMTEAQAKNLLESLKSEDERVQLLQPTERRPGRGFKDW